jgi:hypothetical protein
MGFPGGGMFGPQPAMGGSVFMNSVAQGGGNSLFSGYQMGGGNPAGNIPGLGMLNMITQPMIHGFMGNQGLVPGQFMGTQNLYDQYRIEQRQKEMQEAVGAGAQADRPAMTRFLIGSGQMMGMDMGLDQQATAASMAGHMAQFTPIMAQMMPDLLDKLHGRKGSAAVLARGLMEGGRYAVDPVTGMRGLGGSADADGAQSSVKEMVDAFKDALDDPDSEFSQHGISMGQAGLMYEEMTKRGMLGVRSIGTMSREDQYEALAEDEGISVADVKASKDAGPGGEEAFRTKLRQFDAKRVKSRMEGLAGAVDAMREIFGDLGNPNAPMSQIIEGLNQLTQGGIASMPAAELERMVRMTKAISDNTGMGIDSIMALTSAAASIGDQLGLHRSLAVVAGQRGAIGGRAVADMGWAGVFGTVSSDEAAAMITKSTEQGMASQAGMSTAAIFRMEDQIAGGSFKAGSRAEKLMKAIKRGDAEFEGQSMLDLMTNPNKMREIFKSSGLSDLEADMYQDFITDPAGNQKYIAENPEIVDAIETMQMQEMGGRVAGRATGIALNRALRGGTSLNAEQRAKVSAAVTGPLAQEIWEEATADDRRDTESWQKFVDQKARPRLKAMGLSDAQIDNMLPSLAAGIEAEGNRAAQDQGYDNFDVALQTMGGQTLKQRQRVTATARQDAAIRGALAPLTSRGPLRELMDIVQGGDTSIKDAVGRILGGIPAGDVQDAMVGAMEAIRKNREKMELIDEDRSGKWRDSSGKLTDFGKGERAKAVASIGKAADAANKILDKQGDAYLATTVDAKETAATATRMQKLQDAIGGDATSPDYAKKVDRAQKAAFKEAGSLTNKFLGNLNSMKQLGKGGVDLVEGLEADKGELERLIKEHGSLAEARKAEPGKVDALLTSMNTRAAEIDRRYQEAGATGEIGKGTGGKMTKEEEERVKARQEQAREAPEKRREKVLETLAELAGIDVEDLKGDEDLVARLGSGADLAEIEREATREKRRRELETKVAGGDALTEAEQKELDQLKAAGGTRFEDLGDEGTAGEVDRTLIDEFDRDDAYVDEEAAGEDAPLIKAIKRIADNFTINAMKLTILGDGGGEVAPDNSADSTP